MNQVGHRHGPGSTAPNLTSLGPELDPCRVYRPPGKLCQRRELMDQAYEIAFQTRTSRHSCAVYHQFLSSPSDCYKFRIISFKVADRVHDMVESQCLYLCQLFLLDTVLGPQVATATD